MDEGQTERARFYMLMQDFTLGARRVETRLLMRHPDGVWAGYTYEWNDAQTDATLLPAGKTKTVGGQNWMFPSRDQCLLCHTVAAGRTLLDAILDEAGCSYDEYVWGLSAEEDAA